MIKKRGLVLIALLAAIFLGKGDSFSQGAFWSKVSGLTTAKVNILTIDPSGNLYTGTNGDGIFKSTDDGKNWIQLNTGLTNRYVYSLVIDKVDGNLYAGTIGGGVFRSTNEGRSWLPINTGIQNSNINTLVINKNGFIFAGTSGGGIYFTTDTGENWIKLNTGSMSNYVYSLNVNSLGHLYAGTWSGMYKSTDNGLNWININNGFPNTYVFTIAIDTQGYIYSGTSVEGIIRSTNNGNSWIKINQGLPGLEVRSISINSIGHVFIAVRGFGVFKSTDNGTSWASVSEGLTSTELRSLTIKENGYIFAGTLGGGIFKSLVSTQVSVAVTDTASNISDISATLNGKINPNGFETSVMFQYGLTTDYGKVIAVSPEIVSGSNTQKVSATVTGLAPNSTIHYRIVATNIAGTVYGSDQSFTTLQYPLTMNLNTNSLTFSAFQSGPLPGVKSIHISREGNSALNWTATDNATWLEISPSFGVNESDLYVSINSSGLDTGIYTAKITITAPYTTNSPQIVNVTYIINGQPKLSPNTYNIKFDSVLIYNTKQLTLNISNPGTADLIISSMKIAGTDSSSFGITSAINYPVTIKPGSSFNIRLSYTPSIAITHTAYLQIYNNSNASPIIITVTGICILSSDISIPDQPVLLAPLNNSSGMTINTILSWNSSRNAVSYGFQISTNSSFNNVLYDISTSDTTYKLMNLSYSTQYYWRINASNSRGTSAWSIVYSFVTSGNSSKMSMVSGDNQSCIVYQMISKPLVVKVTDAAGYAVSNAEINFSVSEVPEGSVGYYLLQQKLRTDNDGIANNLFKVGSKSGKYTIQVTVSDVADQLLLFTVNGLPDLPVKLNILNGQNQIGFVNSSLNQFKVQVIDQYQNPIQGLDINFSIREYPQNSSGYSLSISEASTNSLGEAFTVLKIGNYEGRYIINASIKNSVIAPVSFYVLAVLPEYPEKFTIDTSNFHLPVFPNISEFRSTDWRIIGFPGSGNQLVSEYFSGSQNVDWQIYWDNGMLTNYLVKFDGSNRFIDSVGKAFWAITRKGIKSPLLINSVPLNKNKEVEINLHAGWNLITNPYNLPVSWVEIQKYNNITSPIYTYAAGWKTSTKMEPYTGYLFDRPDSIAILKIPYYLAYIGSPALLSQITPNWKVNVILQSGSFSDETSWLGKSNFSLEKSTGNYRKPRFMNDEPGIYFIKNDTENEEGFFATDFRLTINKLNIWEFEAKLEQIQRSMLIITGLSAIPSTFYTYLIDERKNKYDLTQDSVIFFMPAGNKTKFKLITGEYKDVMEYLQKELSPTNYTLGNNYPNPFNPSTTIPIEIPVKTHVYLSVFNILGKEVKIIHNNILNEGRYTFKFDGKDRNGAQLPSGLYIYRMKTGNGISQFNKMILIK